VGPKLLRRMERKESYSQLIREIILLVAATPGGEPHGGAYRHINESYILHSIQQQHLGVNHMGGHTVILMNHTYSTAYSSRLKLNNASIIILTKQFNIQKAIIHWL
jgi:hypothetical protein